MFLLTLVALFHDADVTVGFHVTVLHVLEVLDSLLTQFSEQLLFRDHLLTQVSSLDLAFFD